MPVQLRSHFLLLDRVPPCLLLLLTGYIAPFFDAQLDHPNPGGKVFSLTFQGVVGDCKGAC